MNLKDIYGKDSKTVISYEVFPPKDDFDRQKLDTLFVELNKLTKFEPALISVTYGAGGSNQNESLEIIKRIKNELKVTPMPHFTCVSTGADNIKSYLKTIEELGIENILALRGDIPQNGNICHDFRYAAELVQCIKTESNLSIAVAGYPEGHKESQSMEKDIEFLKRKVDKGADVIYTQMFFNNEHFFSFLELCTKAGIDIPVVPGILSVTGIKQLGKMSSMCKVEIPHNMAEIFDKYSNDKEYIKKYGIEYACLQCQELLENGVKGLHFYTLNKAYAVNEILENLLVK